MKVSTVIDGVEKGINMNALNTIMDKAARKPNTIYENNDSFGDDDIEINKRDYEVTNATIKDGYCIYDIVYIEGTQKGRNVKVSDRKHIILEDMEQAFATFNRHLAVTDDLFIIGRTEVLDIDKEVDHDYCAMFDTNGFVVKGSEENRSIILSGYKRLSLGGTISYTSQRIDLDDTSRYKWHNELRLAMDIVREEVALYHEGKYNMLAEDFKPEGDPIDPAQLKMSFLSPEGIRQNEESQSAEDEKDADIFANAEVL